MGATFASDEGLSRATTIEILFLINRPGSNVGFNEKTSSFTCAKLKVLNRGVEAGDQ